MERQSKYEYFSVFKYEQFENFEHLFFNSFDNAVDEFFSIGESKKLDNEKKNIKSSAEKKVEKVKKTTEDRINRLKDEEISSEKKAKLIEDNC